MYDVCVCVCVGNACVIEHLGFGSEGRISSLYYNVRLRASDKIDCSVVVSVTRLCTICLLCFSFAGA